MVNMIIIMGKNHHCNKWRNDNFSFVWFINYFFVLLKNRLKYNKGLWGYFSLVALFNRPFF